MKTTTKRAEMHQRIRKHREELLAIFPNAIDRDPGSLCRKLRRLEAEAGGVALAQCNGDYLTEGEFDARKDAVMSKVDRLLKYAESGVAVIFNGDPRGYTLKIDDEWMRARPDVRLHRDWGGYGIIAPDLTEHD